MRNQYKVLSEKYSKIKESSQSNGNQELIDYIEDITGNDIDLATDSIRDDGDRSCQAFGWYIVNTTGKKLFVMEKLRHRGSPFKERLTHDNMQNYISDQIFTHIAVNYNGKLEDLKGTKNKDGYYEHSIEELVIGNSPMLGRIGRIGSLQVMSWWNTIESVLPYLDKTLKLAKNNRTIDLNSLVICTVNYVDYYKNIKQQGEERGKTNPRAALARQYHLETDPIKKKQLAQQLGIVPQTPDKPRMQVTGDSVINEDVREESQIVTKARTLTKVLSEKYELQVEVPTTREEKAIYSTKALTQDFVPTAINIYKTQVEPIIKSWPDFDIMTDIKFPHNILKNAKRDAYWAHIYLYKPQDFPRDNIDAILERWFVHSLFERVYKGYQNDSPKSFYRDVQTGRIPPQKSNADFIQYLIKLAVVKMKIMYDSDYKKAVDDRNAIEDWKRSQDIHQKSTDITGIDTSGLVEAKATPEQKAIYNTRALTKNFVPTAIKIYKTQVEPKIKRWPAFDIMTNINFRHNIIINDVNYQGACALNYAGWVYNYLYGPRNLPFLSLADLPGKLDDVLERWFVYYLYNEVYTQNGHPINFYRAIQNGWIYPQKSNADFIQNLIDIAVHRMEKEYKTNYEKAVESGDLEDWKRSQEIYQKNTDIAGIDTSGLVETNTSQNKTCNQYKILAEKYNKVQEAYGFVSESIFWETVKSGVPEDDIEDFIRWYMDNTYHSEGFKEIQERQNCTDLEAICYVYDDIQKHEYAGCKEMFWREVRIEQCREKKDRATVAEIMGYYNEDYKEWKAAQKIHQKSSDIAGIDTSGLVEANDSQDPEEVAEQIIDRAKVVTQNYIKLLNNRRVPGIKLAEYVRQHIHPIIQEILSYVTEKNPHKKAQLENYLKELLTTTWLIIDRVYWDVEMDTIVRGAVEDGEAIIQDLDKMADRGNKQINNL